LPRSGAKLDELEHQLSTVRANIDTLRAELHTAHTAKPSPLPLSIAVARQAPDTPADKVKLFRSLFRARKGSSAEEQLDDQTVGLHVASASTDCDNGTK
jgi:hypothetical protein